MPLALADDSEPEPDVAVAPGTRRDYELAHPSRPALLVEVADSSLADDREVRREPAPSTTAPSGWSYAALATLGPGASIAPVACPGSPIEITAILPRAAPPRA